MRLIASILALALPVLTTTAGSAQSLPPTLEERMPQADFHAAGLDRLTPEELAHLNRWLAQHPDRPPVSSSGFGWNSFYPDDEARGTIQSRITGTFTGWRGETEFRLDNGQRWRQSESGRFDAGEMNNPAVTLEPKMMGSWLMKVEGCGCSVRVRRVE
jgi:hypothetical protein